MDFGEGSSIATAHGMGSAIDHETAMIRAITESVQSRCVFLSGVRDIVPSKEYRRVLRSDGAWAMRQTEKGVSERLDLSGLGSTIFDAFEDDVAFILRRLASVGLDRAIVFRLSRADDPVQAVRVVIPGAEGYIFPYYGPGARAKAAMQHGYGEGSPLFRKEGAAW